MLTFSDGGIQQWALFDGRQAVPLRSGTPTQNVTTVASSTDGRYLAYVEADTMWTIRADSPTPAVPVKVSTASGIHSIAWSPDRSRLAFAHTEGGQSCVSVVAASGGPAILVRCGVDQPSWLPDARTLVVVGGGALQQVEAKADDRLLLTYSGTADAAHPKVSPDGRWIAYDTWIDSPRIAAIPAGGGSPRSVLVNDPVVGIGWDPSATRVIFTVGARVVEVIPVGADGSLGNPSRLVDEPRPDTAEDVSHGETRPRPLCQPLPGCP